MSSLAQCAARRRRLAAAEGLAGGLEVPDGVGEAGLQAERRLELGDRLVEPPQRAQCDAEVVVRLDVARLRGDGAVNAATASSRRSASRGRRCRGRSAPRGRPAPAPRRAAGGRARRRPGPATPARCPDCGGRAPRSDPARGRARTPRSASTNCPLAASAVPRLLWPAGRIPARRPPRSGSARRPRRAGSAPSSALARL